MPLNKNFFGNLLTLDKNKPRSKRILSFGWRFFVVFLLFFYIVTGFSPIDILSKVLASFEEDFEVINLYTGDCSGGEWVNDQNILSVPQVSPTGEKYLFNDENSAMIKVDQSRLYCSGFMPLVDNAEVIVEETFDAPTFADISGGESDASSTDDLQIDGIASSTIASTSGEIIELEVATSTGELSTSSDEVFLTDEGSASSTIATTSSFVIPGELEQVKGIPVQTVEPENSSGTINKVIDEEVEETATSTSLMQVDSDEVSFFESVKNYFRTSIVRAEEMLSEKIDLLSDLGEFQNARLKFSMASLKIVEVVESEEIIVVGITTSSDEIATTATFVIPGELEREKGIPVQIEELENSSSTIDNIIDEQIETPQVESDVASTTDEASVMGSPSLVPLAGDDDRETTTTTSTEVSLNNILESLFLNLKSNEANAETGDAKLVVWYTLETSTSSNSLWTKIEEIEIDNISNNLNGDYFSVDAEFLESWEDIESLRLKLELDSSYGNYEVFVDSLWLEVDYQKASDVEILNKRERWKSALEFLSDSSVLSISDVGEFSFKYNKSEVTILSEIGQAIGLTDFWSDVNVQAKLVDGRGIELDYELDISLEDDGLFSVSLPVLPADFKPGKYKIKFYIEDDSGDEVEVLELSQDFTWGVLAINFNKSVYDLNEEVYIQMGVLDDLGHTICDAEVYLEITNPDGEVLELSTASTSLQVVKNPECGPENIIDTPDYFAYYELNQIGNYQVKMTAVTVNGVRSIVDTFKVEENIKYSVERIGPTRIYPKADYPMTVLVSSIEDTKGDIIESVPADFKIVNQELRIINSTSSDPFGSSFKYYEEVVDGVKNLVWQDVEFKAGDVLEIKYVFDAPDRSPDFYLLGSLSLKVGSTSNGVPFPSLARSAGNDGGVVDSVVVVESRQWQIASDALNQRAKTVQFIGGIYNGGATSGINTNTNNTFTSFNFRLAETGVDIKNAYVVFEAQFEAYDSGGGNYTGYDLVFDSCEESCAADAFFGTNRVIKTDNTVLAYDEGESNQVRLLFDVTSEAQLASYSGGGVEMEAQIGYNIKNATSKTSVTAVKAVLVLTYVYDADSENLTNTVVYPLDSTNGTDSGTRQSSVASCTRNSDCPVFDYKMDIPEFPGVATTTNRLSQWFRMYNANDSNNANDVDTDVNIQTFDVDSATFHHESANSGTQGNMPAMLFDDWASSGYEENATQQLEYYVNTGTNYNVGGEVFETYISSSSASIKTRTVSMPLGVINNGGITSLTSDELDVYFPENGGATGTVSIKKAWLRIIPNNRNSAALTTTVSTKVGNNATSSDLVYAYNGGGTVVKSSFNIIHIIPSSDYGALEEANASTGIPVRLNTTMNTATFGGVSAELMVTYTYSSESSGYLSSLSLIAGQSATNGNDQSEILSTSNSVLPEGGGKVIRAAGLLASYLVSDSDLSVGTDLTLDANLAISSPTCSNAYNSAADSVNEFTEFYKDVASAMNTTDDQSYSACYSNDGAGDVDGGAKMSGELIYTYSWVNTPPTGVFNSAKQKSDGSGVVDIDIEVADTDGHESTAKIEYVLGSVCDFTTPLDPSLDATDSNISADFGDPDIDNGLEFQVGTVDAPIATASGTNSVIFDWDSKTDLTTADDTYCLRLTVFDGFSNQTESATTTLIIDSVLPTAPGALSLNGRTGTSIELNYGATSTDTNFYEYKIFYKEHDGTDPAESDSVLASSSEPNLGNAIFNSAATTSVSGLTAHTIYSFAIWTYDEFGNVASSTRVDIEANDAPTGLINSATQKTDGSGTVDVSIEVDDNNNNDTVKAKVEYVAGLACDFSSPNDPTLSTVNITADFGLPSVENTREYQIGTTSSYIITSPGSNTVDFDWLSVADLPSGDGDYCIRITTNDNLDDQKVLATSAFVIDNVNPITPGSLIEGEVLINSIELIFATTSPSTDTNEPIVDAYKVFYKEGISGVLESDTEYDLTVFDAYDYNSATSTVITGLDSSTYYTFNIWAYDTFGNKVSATEITIKTNATVSNDSFTFVNAQNDGVDYNIVVADNTATWLFRVEVSETNGWTAIASSTLRLANNADNVTPLNDAEFYWDQTADEFYEIGNDTSDAFSISPSSTSNCNGNSCTLDFLIVIDKDFDSFSTVYSAEVRTGNDIGTVDEDSYSDVYQVRRILLNQEHYRWRNDDGGE